MNWYIASRVRHQKKILQIADTLTSQDEAVVSYWIYQGSLKPYEENKVAVQSFSMDVVKNITNSDIFVLISDPEGTDMFIELGIALSAEVDKIYIVGPYSKRSLMQLHPKIIHTDNIQDVFKAEKIDYKIQELDLFA